MRLRPRARGRSSSPDPSELRSITDRARHLWLLRLGSCVVVVATSLAWPSITSVPWSWLACGAAGYLAVSAGALAAVWSGRRIALAALQAGLMLDGIFLAAAIGATGGASSPLALLLGVHVVGVTLACSYRTGLKLAIWNTLLFLWVTQAIQAGLVPGAATTASGAAVDTAMTVVGLWLLALGTAGFSAAGERELRRQKADLADLSAMVTLIDGTDASGDSSRIPAILLERLRDTYGFARGVVLASPEGELELLATTESGDLPSVAAGMDQVMSRAWADKTCQLVGELDPSTDPRLASLLPDASNVVVLPLFLVGGHRLGIVALERGSHRAPMRRWELEMIGQFAAHAALALYNAWLTEQREEQLHTIRELERRLRTQNAQLETAVDERTEELRTGHRRSARGRRAAATAAPPRRACRRGRTTTDLPRHARRSRAEARGGQDASRDAGQRASRDARDHRSAQDRRIHDQEHAPHALRPQPADPRRGRHRPRAGVLPRALTRLLRVGHRGRPRSASSRRRPGSSSTAPRKRRSSTRASTRTPPPCG